MALSLFNRALSMFGLVENQIVFVQIYQLHASLENFVHLRVIFFVFVTGLPVYTFI